jgi:hypothetical protein
MVKGTLRGNSFCEVLLRLWRRSRVQHVMGRGIGGSCLAVRSFLEALVGLCFLAICGGKWVANFL